MEKTVTYFERPGKENTETCLDIVKKAITNHCYRHVVIASTSGSTGLIFSEGLKGSGINIVVVTHSYGFKEPNATEMPDYIRKKLESDGAKVYTGTMITHNIETAFSSKFSGLYPTLIVSHALRRFGEGAKVCCEIVMMAADAGLIPEKENVIAVGGTGTGADTVLIIKSAISKRFLDLKVLEILAKPMT